jgi:hypothetical protein
MPRFDGILVLKADHPESEGPSFPPCRVPGTALLVPISSWEGLFSETLEVGVDFDAFWCQCILDRVAYFFQWLGEPRCTVLTVWNDAGLTYVECRARGDRLLFTNEVLEIEREVAQAFWEAGFTSPDNCTQH